MKTLITKDPFTNKSTGEFAYEDFAGVTAKIQSLRKAQYKWRQLRVGEREELVRGALSYFADNGEQIAQDICEQMGRPQHQAMGEIKGLLERAQHMCDIAETVLAEEVLPKKKGFVRRISHEPMGVVFVIAAWNYPLLIAVNSVVPALIAGNTVLLKHSNLTPKLGQHFVKAFAELGEFSNLVEQIITSHEVTGEVIENTGVDHVVFTGSVYGGKRIQEHCGHRLITPLLELGGKDGAYVHEDANLEQAVDAIVDGAMFNAGQSCCGIERVYVHEKVHDEFVDGAQKLLAEYRLGDPKSRSTSMGPVAKISGLEDMQTQVVEAMEGGAKLICGGKNITIGEGHFFEPTLLTKVASGMKVMREENFGPIMPVMKVAGLDEAIEQINECDFGLTAAIFTGDQLLANKFADEVIAGTVFMNRCDYLDPALPWTGIKDSGAGGSSLSQYGFYGVTRRKAKHFKTNT